MVEPRGKHTNESQNASFEGEFHNAKSIAYQNFFIQKPVFLKSGAYVPILVRCMEYARPVVTSFSPMTPARERIYVPEEAIQVKVRRKKVSLGDLATVSHDARTSSRLKSAPRALRASVTFGMVSILLRTVLSTSSFEIGRRLFILRE